MNREDSPLHVRPLPLRAINRARKKGAPLYCGRECAGLGRRKGKTKEQKVREKSAYDAAYRAKNITSIKAKKAAHFRKTYDPAEAAKVRKARMPHHIEYCRRPEYRQYKSGYDKRYRATKDFGEFAEVAMLLSDIEKEVLSRATRYEINLMNGKLNKATRRKQAYENFISG